VVKPGLDFTVSLAGSIFKRLVLDLPAIIYTICYNVPMLIVRAGLGCRKVGVPSPVCV